MPNLESRFPRDSKRALPRKAAEKSVATRENAEKRTTPLRFEIIPRSWRANSPTKIQK